MAQIDRLAGTGIVMRGRDLISRVKYRVTVTTDPEAAYPHYSLEVISSDPPLTMLSDRLTLIVEDKRKLDFFVVNSSAASAVTTRVTNAVYV